MVERRPNTRPSRGASVGLKPTPGLYKTRLVSGGPWVPARIWYGPPLDPDTRKPLDRAHRLQAIVAGEECDPYDRWPMHEIGRAEFDRLVAAMPENPREPRRLHDEETLF